MQLSAPLYRLKRTAKLLSRNERIPLHEALDRIANQEGFSSWSLLAARAFAASPATKLFPQFSPGDLVLIGARQGQGKTLLSLELTVEAMKRGQRGVFFTLEYTQQDVNDCFHAIGAEPSRFAALFELDTSDEISADYIIEKLAGIPRGSFVVIDYLQLLDQKRHHAALMDQVRKLASFARETGIVIAFISQIDRAYAPSRKAFPGLEDIRLPNALDLALFNKACFLSDGKIQFTSLERTRVPADAPLSELKPASEP